MRRNGLILWLVISITTYCPMGIRWVKCQNLRPCTDLKPIYLLRLVAPDRYHLPAGMEIIYDDKSSVHAFRFTPRANTLNFKASPVFKYCKFFPEEYSVLVTLKVGRQTAKRDEAIFALLHARTGDVKMGLRLAKGKLHFDYTDRLTPSGRKRVVEFRHMKIFDRGWHTVIISVTGNTVTLRADCGKLRTKRLRRVFPALVNVDDSNFYVANQNRRKGQFTGWLKQLLILPGSDVATLTCPARRPSIPDIGLPEVYGSHMTTDPRFSHDSICTWTDTGKIWFDIYSKTLRVCYSGIWQAILLPPDQRLGNKLDYFVWHQDIITAAPTIDIEVFRIPEEGLFMAMASYDSRVLTKQPSAIFKWDRGRFKLYQSLTTLGAQAWEHFQIGKQFFLAVANQGAKREKPSKSVIYRWSRKRKRFQVYQEIATWTARDLEYFEISGEHYILVANHVKGENHSIDSVLYKWNPGDKKFLPIQNIETTGAYDWTYFVMDGYHFLAVANSFSGSTTRLDSIIYFWQSGKFVKFQTIQTTGATDWEHFRIGDDFYLVVANAFDYGPHNLGSANHYAANSTIYKMNKIKKQFEVYQDILTHSAIDWEFFKVGDDFFLAVSNAQEKNGNSLHDKSVIYRWQGVAKFVAAHHLDTLPSADFETFTVNGEVYLVYANAQDSISQVFKAKYV